MDRRIRELLDYYPNLRLMEDTDESSEVSGTITIHRKIDQFVLYKTYQITVVIPKTNGQLPYVIDSGCAIDKGYSHRYKDGRLCLSTDIDMKVAFDSSPSLVSWMEEFVEPFYVSYEYYRRYGIYPMGERNHGEEGIVQSYMDLFALDGLSSLRVLNHIVNGVYRGHQPCPCGSGKKTRNCHGELIRRFKNNGLLFSQAKADFIGIIKRAEYEYAKQQENSGITK